MAPSVPQVLACGEGLLKIWSEAWAVMAVPGNDRSRSPWATGSQSSVSCFLTPGQGGLETQTPFLSLTESHACGIPQVLYYASHGVTHPACRPCLIAAVTLWNPPTLVPCLPLPHSMALAGLELARMFSNLGQFSYLCFPRVGLISVCHRSQQPISFSRPQALFSL